MKGFLLIEVLIAIMILIIINRPTVSFFSAHFKSLKSEDVSQQLFIEEMDIYSRILQDMSQESIKMSTSCCFLTSNHTLCYDVKNNRLRRRKKRHLVTRYFTSYIGNKDQIESLNCEVDGDAIIFNIQKHNGDEQWVYLVP